MNLLRRVVDRLNGTVVPPSFTGTLERSERVLASAETVAGQAVLATSRGLWLPEGAAHRRIGWELIAKARWNSPALEVIEASVAETVGAAAVLADLPEVTISLATPGKVPETVHQRVQSSIADKHHRRLPSGGAWFVQRRVPGEDGVVLQVRPDPGTDIADVRSLTSRILARAL